MTEALPTSPAGRAFVVSVAFGQKPSDQKVRRACKPKMSMLLL